MTDNVTALKTLLTVLSKRDKGTLITNADVDRYTAAFLAAYQPNTDPATLTRDERAIVVLENVYAYITGTTHAVEVAQAQEQARLAITRPEI